MSKLSVPEMMCENCVKRISSALNGAGLSFSVSLETKSVEVAEGCEQQAIDALADVGFDAEVA